MLRGGDSEMLKGVDSEMLRGLHECMICRPEILEKIREVLQVPLYKLKIREMFRAKTMMTSLECCRLASVHVPWNSTSLRSCSAIP